MPSRIKNSVTVQVKFANLADAEKAKKTFNGQMADGRTLEVAVLSNATANSGLTTLASGAAIGKGQDLLPDTSSAGTGM